MAQMYQLLASIAQSVGVLYFMGMFLAVVAYALWPRNRETFDRAASVPLDDE
ncbi:MAG: cbb3-type cytochrome c oxidase subunit 3 [Beijerinckiaceae bacterium]|nr:cbb3-type cytochrome c oxidase subunit 3 [Beijerinckiaceae bacterium]